MTWRTDLSSNSRTVEVICSDHISPDDLTMFAIEITYLIKQHGSTRILMDFSKARIDFSLNAAHDLFEIYAEYHILKTVRTAIVYLDQRNRADDSKLLAVAKEYGFELMLFTGNEEARKWLED